MFRISTKSTLKSASFTGDLGPHHPTPAFLGPTYPLCQQHLNQFGSLNTADSCDKLIDTQTRDSHVYMFNHTHTHTFNGPFSRTTLVGRYKKGKTKLDFTEARDSEWQWHQLGHMQVCTSFQTDNHTSTSPLSFLQAECPSCRPTNSVKALKAHKCLII